MRGENNAKSIQYPRHIYKLGLRSQNSFFFWKSKNIVFLHRAMEKPYLNLCFKFHDFFLRNNEDMKILSLGFFFLFEHKPA